MEWRLSCFLEMVDKSCLFGGQLYHVSMCEHFETLMDTLIVTNICFCTRILHLSVGPRKRRCVILSIFT